MVVNTEFFIPTVQIYPVLYDTSHEDYKNKIWDSIAEIIGESDGDSLKKQWKNLRDAYSKHLRLCKTSTGQAAKLIDRYKTWPWASQMSFLRPHLEFAETSSNVSQNTEETGSFQAVASNVSQNTEEAGSSQAVDRTPPINTAQSLQNDTHVHSRRKRTPDGTRSQVDKVIDFMNNNRENDDDTDLLFKSYAIKFKKMSDRRHAFVKFEIAKIMLKAELEESDEMQLISDDGRNSENMVMIVQQPLSSAGSNVNDSTYIIPSPSPPASESVDGSLSPPSNNQPSYIQPSHNQPSLTQPLYTQPSHTRPSLTQLFQPSHAQPSLTQPSYTQPSHTRPSLTQLFQPSHAQPSLTQPSCTQSSYTQPSRTQTQIKKTKTYYEQFGNNL